jgi:DNA repair protein RecN (Recombination protein N)
MHLSVRHLAVVDDLSLDFTTGMTSLTGETGAGKSLIVDALGLVLGDRADSSMVRHHCDRAEIEASFDIQHNEILKQWLKENELDDDEQCNLRRTISKDGRSRAYINGRSVTLSQLKTVSEYSIDIHGQHAHQSLLRPETQRTIIDTVANTQKTLSELSQCYKEWQTNKQQLEAIKQRNDEQAAHLELLRYQVEELEQFELSDSIIEGLLSEQQQLAHASEITQTVESAIYQLFDQEQGNTYSTVSQLVSEFETIQNYDESLSTINEMLNSVVIQLDECGSELRRYIENIDINPSRLNEVEQTLSALHDLSRKHHIEIEQLPQHYQQLVDELHDLAHLSENQSELEQLLQEQEKKCLALCGQLSKQRKIAAVGLAKELTTSIQQLAMPAGHIEIALKPMNNGNLTETGSDQIQFLVSTNPGQQAGELAKVASGGELARISLAIQVATAGNKRVSTLVFDEVDVGIGGGVAEVVGQHLRHLAQTRQVLCITHLPQVAAQAHQQLQVSKTHSTDSTHIEINQLSNSQRIEEIARMLGGVNITEKTLSHAEEMLSQMSSWNY